MSNREELVYEVANLFYLEELTQTAISKKLNISRPTVATMLREAKNEGIVSISINYPKNEYIELQKKISQKYNIKNVNVVASYLDSAETKKNLGNAAAKILENNLQNILTLGLGWGTTIHELVENASYFNSNLNKIIPLIGGFGVNKVKYHSNHLAFKLAEKYNCDVAYFYAPAIAENEEIFRVFQSSVLVNDIIEEIKKVDLAIMTPDNPLKLSAFERMGYITSKEKKKLSQVGVRGNILGSFYDEDGEEVHTSFANRMIGLKLTDFPYIKELMVLASGNQKKESTKVLISNNPIDYLIIDKDIADYLVL